MKAGLQLYSIKDETKKDMLASLDRVASLGYEGVEFAGYEGVDAQTMKQRLDTLGLRSIGTHMGMERFEKHLDEEIAYHKVLGTKYLILPWASFKTMEDVLRVADLLSRSAKIAADHQMTVGYHNHAHEFEKIEGKYVLDLLMEHTDEKVVFELDVFWAAVANVDPVEYIHTRSRIELIHIKELAEHGTRKNTDVGKGVLDFPAIVAAAKAQGAKEFIVEQEESEGCIWDSVQNGMEFLLKI